MAQTPITPHSAQSTDHVAPPSPNSAQHVPTIIPDRPVNPNPDSVHHMVTHFRVGTNRPVERFTLHMSSVSPLPRSYREAFNDVNWQSAMRDEYNALIKNSTWTLIPRPPDVNVVRCMWLFHHKYLADGTLSRYKARLVANGSTQLEVIDVNETFSPVVKPETIHTVLSLATSRHWSVHQLDVKNAILHGDLSETVYMHQPLDLLHRIISSLHQEFAMTDLGSLTYFLGISVTRDSSVMFLSQKKYAAEILERAGMVNCNPSRTPADIESKLGTIGDVVFDPTLYQSLAGSLQYLTFTRPDISYDVQQACLHMHDPREPYFSALKRILRYVCCTLDYGLQLFSSSTTNLVAYSDANWAGCPTTRRSGYCIFLGNNLLSWSAKRQQTLSRFSAEAEYRGGANDVAETCWLRNLLRELHTSFSFATFVYCDNVIAVYLSFNPVQHQRTKHVEIDIHFVHDLVATGQVWVLHVPSRYQFADIFTKELPSTLLEEFRSSLNVRCLPAQTARKVVLFVQSLRTCRGLVHTDEEGKNCKRFGFVRFINVFSEERLVNNLCTTWIERCKLHANISRFHRNTTYGSKEDVKGTGARKDSKPKWSNNEDLSKSILGRVKVFASLANLKMALCNEGFVDIKIQYMDASLDFHTDKRIAWVEIEEIPFKLWSGKTFNRIAAKWGELLDVDDQEDTCFHSKQTSGWVPDFAEESDEDDQDGFIVNDDGQKEQIPTVFGEDSDGEEVQEKLLNEVGEGDNNLDEGEVNEEIVKSEDPFNIYPILNKKVEKGGCNNKSEGSLKYPPGFSPIVKKESVSSSVGDGNNYDDKGSNKSKREEGYATSRTYMKHKEEGTYSISFGHFKKSEAPRTGGSILGLLDEVVKVGQVMGYKMEGCMSNMEEIIEAQGAKEMESMDTFCARRCWGNLAFDFVHRAAVGNLGGVLCMWDPNSFHKERATKSDSFIMVRGEWCLTGQKFLLIAVYAPQDAREKRMLWDYLHGEIMRWKGEVVVMGDFNEVRHKSDRFGSVFNAHDASTFNTFILNSGLVEVELGGCAFTWCHKSATKMSKLDRFLVSDSLLNTCPNVNAITLERYLLDHRPILLREAFFDYGPTPFKIFHHWFEIEGFNKMVEDTWKEYPGVESNAIRYLMGKLKYLKSKIRVWNITSRSSVNNAKMQYKSDLDAIDEIIDSGNGDEIATNKRVEIINKLLGIDHLQSMEAAQKAKIKWAVEGDENSSFFQGMLKKKRNILNVRGVMVDGVWVDNPVRVKREFYEYFKARFCQPGRKDATIQMEFPYKQSDEKLSEIEGEVTNDEIKRAVWDCIFFLHCEFPKGCNSSFIALIPKNQNAHLVKDFRPISLIGSLYKIIAKILANRLVGVLSDIVNEVQSAFISDRQILDGPFILNEVVQWCKSKKKQALIFKVDFEKAYDSVRWDFLDEILKKFGFEDKWCKWILSCLRSSRGSIIVNGSPTEEFQFVKGLKQGDPLSPFLFILVMESLHLSFQRIDDAGMFHGIKLGGGSVNLSHMFYADDAVFVGQWCNGNITTLVHVLDCFHTASGLRINMCKSKIMGVHVDDDTVIRAAGKLGCMILNAPFSYLGSIVGGNMSRIQMWKDIADRIKLRLSKWKIQTLSIGGRLTLVKSVLGSMPLYYFSIYRVSKAVLHELESIRSYFFNGHGTNNNKATWVNWKKVLLSKNRGGLGVSSLYAMNRGLMFK
uniref:Putative RNA-directed DNA polymerase, eukaryota, reverse transcriptase zinc-binding domain protein n=1 Tax=Tanacetum cinerariifolium TaxID=118510 RepID=A0A6L2NHE4_TANCI|nr:putative RNA-directed DNA polymerase, eukaryota, reverse transcriptase zinc-binding domain protein [Tanacetum cinerariifolium]